MGDFLRAQIAAGRTYLPAGKNVLRAFQQPFDEVRVLIVGQDPYPTPGHALVPAVPDVSRYPAVVSPCSRPGRQTDGATRAVSRTVAMPCARSGIRCAEMPAMLMRPEAVP